MTKPINTSGGYCPLWKKQTSKVCHTCELWDHVRGKHPQSGADLDHWACAFKMHTMLSIEHTMVARQTTASVDELRKEVHRSSDQAMAGAIGHLNRELQAAIPVSPQKLIEN